MSIVHIIFYHVNKLIAGPPNCKKILLIGNTPPPLGGVTIYVQRRRQQLQADGHWVDVFPSRPSAWLLLQILPCWLVKRYDLIEINSVRVIWPIILRACFPTTFMILIDHNDSKRFANNRRVENFLLGVVLQLVNRIDTVQEWLVSNYAHCFLFDQLQFRSRSPFIPPDSKEEMLAKASWPSNLIKFITGQAQLIIACASDLNLTDDIYRFLDCVSVFAEVYKHNKAARLLLISSRCTDDYAQAIQQRIKDLQLTSAVLFTQDQIHMWPLFKQAKLLLRLTTTDGDSISIREALALGCPVIASNVVERPEQVITVALDNFDDTAAKIMAILNSQTPA